MDLHRSTLLIHSQECVIRERTRCGIIPPREPSRACIGGPFHFDRQAFRASRLPITSLASGGDEHTWK